MRFWFGTCVILAPAIILPAAMNGWPGSTAKQHLTAEQKSKYKAAYEKGNYFTCEGSNGKSNESEGCKNEKILNKARQKLKEKKRKN